MREFVVPFVYIDGVPTMRDSQIAAIHSGMVRDGTLDDVYWLPNDVSKFIAFMKSVRLFAYFVGEEIAMAVWLTDIHNLTACAHFYVDRKWRGKAVPLGKAIVRYAIDQAGYKMLIGHTPSWNRLAISYARRIGGELLGELPFGGITRRGKECPLVVTYYT